MKKKILSVVLSLATLTSLFTVMPKVMADNVIPAFPGAEGGGMYATGGRGGTVVHVTNLNDSGPGSFRDAVAHSNRIVVFDVGGTINLSSDVSCAGNVTIAGQTAPGGKGITLKGGKLAFGGGNIIARFISSRPGEKGSGDYDAWGGRAGCNNTIIDHCSIGWANDEQFGLYSDNTNQTVQYTIVGPSNCVSYHSKGAHGFGVMFGSGQNSWHHNLLCHSLSRNFRGKVGGTNTMDFVNNVIYNWGYQTAYGTMGHINYVGNYLKMGPSTRGGQRFLNMSSGTGYEKFRFYLTGNKIMKPDGTPWSESLNANNWDGGVNYGSHGGEADYRVDTYFPLNAPNGEDVSVAPDAESADEAFETVTSYAGASVNPADNSVSGYNYSSDNSRTKIDAQVLYETRTGTGSLTGGRDFSTVTDSDVLDAISTYGIQFMDYNSYYPEAITEKEITDSDNDGMPDEWELKRGLDPNNTNDANGDYFGQGYTNIEYYINDLTVNAFPEGVVTLSPELVDLGEDYQNLKDDMDSVSLSTSTIREVGDLTLPTTGSKGSTISWSSSSSAITINNNKITGVKRPGTENEAVSLTATFTNGEFTLKKSFTVTVLALPYKFDFGGGSVQSGYAQVSASTVYSSNSSYGFVDNSSVENMERAPYKIPTGYENIYSDQVTGTATFRTELPNGKYFVTIDYGCWNKDFGANYTVEGISSGNLASTDAAQYVVEVEVTDGVLDVDINKGSKSYGGYINGLEISKTRPTGPDVKYHFDFGAVALQDGYTEVTAGTEYSSLVGYGFDDISSLESTTREASNIPVGYENLYTDQVIGESTFRTNLPNGKYNVTIHYGTWNDAFATTYTIEGKSSGSLAATDAAKYTTTVEVTDGVLDIAISKGNASYGGYISGLDITPMPTLPYHFDFGDGNVQDGYTAVTSSTLYSEKEYGFVDSSAQSSMNRAPSNIPAGSDELYNDQILGTENTEFKVNLPNGRYNVIIHYGSWNKDFGTNYTIEGVSSGNLSSLDAAQYSTVVDVNDGVLDLSIDPGNKQYGGYISGMDVIAVDSPTTPPTTSPTTPPTTPPTSTPTLQPEKMPYESAIELEGNNVAMNVEGSENAPEADAIIAQYNSDGTLISVNMKSISGSDRITDTLNENTAMVKTFIWSKSTQKSLSYVSNLAVE